MSKVWVCGCNGQLGSEIRNVVAKGCSVHEWLFTDAGQVDITDADAVRNFYAENCINVLINCAAYTAVDAAESDEKTAEAVNHLAVGTLARMAAMYGVFIIHISTDYVFSGDSGEPYKEDMPASPQNVYGRTKWEGEKAVMKSGAGYIILRTSWLYSTYGHNFVKTMMALTSERESIKVVSDQKGSPTYAAYLAKTIYDMVENGSYATHGGTYHYANEGECTWYELACEVARMAGNDKCNVLPCSSEEYPTPVKRPTYSTLDTSKIKRVFGIVIPHWKEALQVCMNELRKRQ